MLQRGTRVVVDAIDSSGVPLLGANLTARCNGGTWFPAALLLEARSANGRMDLGRLESGDWEFRIDHPLTGPFTTARPVGGGATVTVLARAPR